MEVDLIMPLPPSLKEVAATFGEFSVHSAGGMKSAVGVGERYVFKVTEAGKESGADQKELRVLRALAVGLPPWARPLVATVVDGVSVQDLGYVEVQTRLAGEVPEQMSSSLAEDLGRFLSALHGVTYTQDVTEFEGEAPREFFAYLLASAEKFQSKLDRVVDSADRRLVDGAVDLVRRYVAAAGQPPPLVIVHKDLSLGNLLVTAGRLTGVIDWAAAQTAPREWEFAIVEQRFGEWSDVVRDAYGSELDAEVLRVCGALQAIRFWKSFVGDEQFVEEQRNLLRRVL